MTKSNRDVKGYSEELVRVASYPPFLTLTMKTRLGIYRDHHERVMPKSKAAWGNIIASCCGVIHTQKSRMAQGLRKTLFISDLQKSLLRPGVARLSDHLTSDPQS